MKLVKLSYITVALLALLLVTQAAYAEATADRLYVIECGERTAPDVSPWTPGVNVGQPIDFVDTCYVLKHGNDWMVWDTGLPDAIYSKPSTDASAWRRTNTLEGELAKIGIKPADVKYLAVSHTHPDHIGNVELFPQAMLLVQQAEYDWPTRTAHHASSNHTRSPSCKVIMMFSVTAASPSYRRPATPLAINPYW